MCDETRKAYERRFDAGWFNNYIIGSGIDIGCGYDKVQSPFAKHLNEVGQLLTFECRGWEKEDGDAQFMSGIADETFDFVYSSHCLEHMFDPSVALSNWWRILKPGGHLIVIVPDEDLYEQGVWPSKGNGDHKTTWTVYKDKSWSPVSRNLRDEIVKLLGGYDKVVDKYIKVLQQVDTNYDYELAKKGWIDQTGQCIGGVEAAVEAVIQKPA